MESFNNIFNDYAQQHQKNFTKMTHFIGVPMIIFSIQMFFNLFHLYSISLAWIIFICLLLFYAILDIGFACITGIFLFFLTYAATCVTTYQSWSSVLMLSICLFSIGWIFQFIGHYFEKKPPAFYNNFIQLFIAPIFLSAEIYFILGNRKDLH